MKIISDISLKDFGFWSGAKDTAEQLTDEQFDQVEGVLEDLYPNGMTDTQINDLFWFDREFVLDNAGVYPKFYKITAECGFAKYVKVNGSNDQDTLENSDIADELVDEDECDDVEDIGNIDLDEFQHTHFFNVWSRVKHNQKTIFCTGDDAADDLKVAFELCKVEEITTVSSVGIEGAEDWFDYDGDDRAIEEFVYDEDDMYYKCNIPTYAVNRICQLILNPNDELDYYDIPDTFALNQLNRDIELNDEDIKNIDEFVNMLNTNIPGGYTIDWDKESCESPSFEPYPEFGLAMDCVILRVYPKGNNNDNN